MTLAFTKYFPSSLAMSLVDSEAAFQKRCDELLDGLHDMFVYLQITTFSGLAFSVGTPQPVVEQDMQRFADRVVQGPASIAEVSVIKRIHFEAQTLLMADVRKQATVGDTSEPSKSLPYVEKKDVWTPNRIGSLVYHMYMNKGHRMH